MSSFKETVGNYPNAEIEVIDEISSIRIRVREKNLGKASILITADEGDQIASAIWQAARDLRSKRAAIEHPIDLIYSVGMVRLYRCACGAIASFAELTDKNHEIVKQRRISEKK